MSQIKTEHLYIEKDPERYEGKAVIKNTRIPVASIVNHYRSGMSIEEILEGYPSLKPAQLFDALSYYFDNKEEIDIELTQMIKLYLDEDVHKKIASATKPL